MKWRSSQRLAKGGTVRRATLADAVMLHLVAAATYPLASAPDTPQQVIDDFVDENLSVRRFREHLVDDTRSVFIAEYDGTPAGYSMLKFGEDLGEEAAEILPTTPRAELCKFYLLAGRHGTGLADQLMRVSLEEAHTEGVKSLWLGVEQHNTRANAFYERYRFALRGEMILYLGAHAERSLIRERLL